MFKLISGLTCVRNKHVMIGVDNKAVVLTKLYVTIFTVTDQHCPSKS